MIVSRRADHREKGAEMPDIQILGMALIVVGAGMALMFIGLHNERREAAEQGKSVRR